MKSPIKHLFVSSALYLPLCFFVWFFAAGVLVLPCKWLLDAALQWWQSDLFSDVSQRYYWLTVETLIFPSQSVQGQEDRLALLDVTVNPMIYGYGLALFSGLTLSTPTLHWSQRVWQILLAYGLVVLIQSFGCFWQTIKILMLEAGDDAQKAILDTGMGPDWVAGMYQLSYLILPAILPVVLWILLNRKFIEALTHFTEQRENKELSPDDQV